MFHHTRLTYTRVIEIFNDVIKLEKASNYARGNALVLIVIRLLELISAERACSLRAETMPAQHKPS